MKLPIFIILSLLTISSQAFRPRSRFADQVRSIETPQILDTFSLSWQGDLGLSQVVGGVSKIVEGFASCKLNIQFSCIFILSILNLSNFLRFLLSF